MKNISVILIILCSFTNPIKAEPETDGLVIWHKLSQIKPKEIEIHKIEVLDSHVRIEVFLEPCEPSSPLSDLMRKITSTIAGENGVRLTTLFHVRRGSEHKPCGPIGLEYDVGIKDEF